MTYLFYPFYELFEENSPEYKQAVDGLKDKTERKDIITAINTFIQDKLNLLVDGNLITQTNDSISNNKKLLIDEHYVGKDNNNLIIKDSNKEGSKGKPIDLDRRDHRRTIGVYLKQVSMSKILTKQQVSAMNELVAYINELNKLADEQDTWFNQIINNLKNNRQSYNKSLRKALLKDLNQDSAKYGFLKEGIIGWGNNASKNEADQQAKEEMEKNKQEEVKEEVEEGITTVTDGVKKNIEEFKQHYKQIILPDGVTAHFGQKHLTKNTDGSTTAKVDIMKDEKQLGVLNVTLDTNNKITEIEKEGGFDGYNVVVDSATKGVTITEQKITDQDAKVEQDGNQELKNKVNSLSMETGTKRVNLNDPKNQTVLKDIFTDIAKKDGYTTIISTDDDGTIDLNDTISAFQIAYMGKTPGTTIGGKKGPDGIIGPKTLRAMRSVLGIEAETGNGGNAANGGSTVEKNDGGVGTDVNSDKISINTLSVDLLKSYKKFFKSSNKDIFFGIKKSNNQNEFILSCWVNIKGRRVLEQIPFVISQENGINKRTPMVNKNALFKVDYKENGGGGNQYREISSNIDESNGNNSIQTNVFQQKESTYQVGSIEQKFINEFKDSFVGADIGTIKINSTTNLVESFTLIASTNPESTFEIGVTYNTDKTVQGFHIIKNSSIKSYPLLEPRTPDYHNQKHSIKYQKSDNKRHIQKL
ncbi:MAG TPA: hypothetical protein PK048_03325 [Candidatus Absconditabacterales bacterium]|nr:hypothetical protein [Candidatus Absconditabacterales bacterium]